MFRESAGQDHVIGREQGVNVAYNGILRQFERPGRPGRPGRAVGSAQLSRG